jgi:hypothetical protein
MINILHITDCPGEKHDFIPKDLNQDYKNSYICIRFDAPYVYNTRTIKDSSLTTPGVGKASKGGVVFASQPLCVELVEKMQNSKIIANIIIFRLGQSPKAKKDNLQIMEVHKFIGATIISLSPYGGASSIEISSQKTNSFTVMGFLFNQYHISMSVFTSDGKINKVKSAISNMHGFAKQ